MPSMNFRQNLMKSFSGQEAWINHASAIATGLFYPIVPKLLGLDGYAGLAVGAGVPALLGALTGTPGALHSALGIMSCHLGYVYVAPAIFEDGSAWSLVDDGEGVSGLAESSIVTLPNGEQVTVYDYPSNNNGMNDYYQESMSDYYEDLSDYYSDDQTQAVSMNDDFQEFKF